LYKKVEYDEKIMEGGVMDLQENATTEFKREYTDEIRKTVAAFANTSGGTLYIGVADDGSVIGVKKPDDIMLKVSNTIRDSIKPDITLFVRYTTEKIAGALIIKVQVQKGTASPYYLAGKGIRPEGVYVRNGASSVPASETAILKMIKETDGEKYEDTRSLNQDLLFTEAGKKFKSKNIPLGINQKKTLKLMTSGGVYTNLGLLLSDQCVHTIKLAVFEGTDKEVFRERREFSGSVLCQLDETFHFIDIYNHTRAEVSGLYRRDTRDYPAEALREALLNAIVHRDYSFRSSTLISIFDDRIEFVSIGGLVTGISLDDIMMGVSVARNENLANIFYRLELIEAYGTGIPKIVRRYDACPRKPKIEATSNAFKITLPNMNAPGKQFHEEGDSVHDYWGTAAESWRQVPAEGVHAAALSENEKTVMRLFENKNSIVRKDAENILSVSQSMAARVLKGLVDKAILRTAGKGRQTRYELAKDPRRRWP
jgi:ATP-dependent DNA helicase RecG